MVCDAHTMPGPRPAKARRLKTAPPPGQARRGSRVSSSQPTVSTALRPKPCQAPERSEPDAESLAPVTRNCSLETWKPLTRTSAESRATLKPMGDGEEPHEGEPEASDGKEVARLGGGEGWEAGAIYQGPIRGPGEHCVLGLRCQVQQ